MRTMALATLGMLLPAAFAAGGNYKLTPKYAVGQEIQYLGTIVDSYVGKQGAAYEQPYELDTSMLVLRNDSKGACELGCFTITKTPNRDPEADRKGFNDVASYHFDAVKVSATGAATWNLGVAKGANILLPTEGHAPWEVGYCLEVPEEPVQVGGSWIVQRSGQPSMSCKVVAAEVVDGENCAKIDCVQTSPMWTNAKAAFPAWKNHASVWISERKGAVMKVSRVLSIRHPGDAEISRTIKTEYVQVMDRVAGPQELVGRIADFEVPAKAQMDYEKVAGGTAERTPRGQYSNIKHQLKYALEKPYASPYRQAMNDLMAMAETAEKAASSGRKPPLPSNPYQPIVGQKAKHFVAKVLDKDERISPKTLKGRMACLVYVDPESPLSTRALEAVLKVCQGGRASAEVYAVCKNTSAEAIEQLKIRVPGKYVICKPEAIDRSYAMIAYPHSILIDADGIVRANFVGFGPELAQSVHDEVVKAGNAAARIATGSESKTGVR